VVFTSVSIGRGPVAGKHSKTEHAPKMKLICKLSGENSLRVLFSPLQNGKIIAIVRGVNTSLLNKKITELVQEEREIAAGQKECAKVLAKHILQYK